MMLSGCSIGKAANTGDRRKGLFSWVLLMGIALLAAMGPADPALSANEPFSLAGRFLIASEEMRDPNFARTVIYMVNHDAGGAFGLIVNLPLGSVSGPKLAERLELEGEVSLDNIPAGFGGPVEPQALFVLHSDDALTDNSVPAGNGLALTFGPEVLRGPLTGQASPERFSLFLGYSGWGPGQLEREITEGSWIDTPADPTLIFDPDNGTKWHRARGQYSIPL